MVSPRYMPTDAIQVVIWEEGLPFDYPAFSDGTAYAFNSRITELNRELPGFEVFDVGRLPAGDLRAVLFKSRYTRGSGTVDRIDWILGGPVFTVAYVAFDYDGPISSPDEKRRLAEAILRSIRVELNQPPAPAP